MAVAPDLCAINMIELKNIIKEYTIGENKQRVLDDVDLSIADGEFLAIMGPSGSGKSTLMNIIGMLDNPSSGSYIGSYVISVE